MDGRSSSYILSGEKSGFVKLNICFSDNIIKKLLVVEINVITTRFILHEGKWKNKMYHFKKKKHARYLLKVLEKKVIIKKKKILHSE